MAETYSSIRADDAFGIAFQFKGPGMLNYGPAVHPLQCLNIWANKNYSLEFTERQSENVVRILNCAYEAGKEAAKREIRELLGAAKRGGEGG